MALKPQHNQYETEEFKELQKNWYKKLKEEGFVDIEKEKHGFKSYIYANGAGLVEGKKNQYSATYRNSKIEYYRAAEHFLNEYKFKSNLDKVIWEYHSNGISTREISKLLADAKVLKTSYTTIWQTVKRIRTLMKKKYKIK